LGNASFRKGERRNAFANDPVVHILLYTAVLLLCVKIRPRRVESSRRRCCACKSTARRRDRPSSSGERFRRRFEFRNAISMLRAKFQRGSNRGRTVQSGAEQSSCSEGSLLSAGSSEPEDECRSSRGDLASSIPPTPLASASSIPDTSGTLFLSCLFE
jgi:hypothetical protein